ncbi:hypothetical protein [Sphingomonas sp. SORGH_AS_0879]|uniref:hypothetical protein n=1 Tax=Sphingomonas sp. SORGH_AS_0879 TaxID=3041790 RepID=UPI00277E9210|nr:hypothetical protein [Sphingomonas sp. SORGH_AS_0879]MDQ1229687.1 hypothetical protein [Sphingomonas sp. SORGH_AS_0879]
MRLTIALVIGLAAVPATAQRPPITKLLDKIPSVFGSGPKQPAITLPATPVILGLTRAADRSVAGDPVTFDLGGFRLGMSEAEVTAVIASRKLTNRGVTRYVDFESQVRSLINIRGGVGGVETRRGVLGEATLQDDAGGRYMLKTLVWPDGAHLSSIVYLAPQGTAAAEWRRMLVEKWGRPREEQPGDTFGARWGGGTSAFRAAANLGPRGGTVEIAQPEGSSQQPGKLVEQATDAFIAARARKPSL